MSASCSFCKKSNKVHPPSSPYIDQKSAKSNSAVREEDQGKRKPRERQKKTNKMRDCAQLKAESQVFLIKTRLCLHPQEPSLELSSQATQAGGSQPPQQDLSYRHWRAGTTTLFLLSSQPPQIVIKFQHCPKRNSCSPYKTGLYSK